ncbi:fts3-like protein [Dermatophagoides farinae]|uniref:Ferritin n=1 Tax=Dermatophagoides farinae TaxID=6954 RepID=A0A922HFS7_DERFA|nr:fts3-like protein [Dermatophagoides farinae]
MAGQSSKIRMNFHQDCENGINRLINLELYASYTYQQMANHFNRDDVALLGFEKFFNESSQQHRKHYEHFIQLQNQRGGHIVLDDIQKPIEHRWSSGLEAMNAAMELEKTMNQSLLDLHSLASKHNDPHFADFIESHYLDEQVEVIKKLSTFITNLERCGGTGIGEYFFDHYTLQQS